MIEQLKRVYYFSKRIAKLLLELNVLENDNEDEDNDKAAPEVEAA